MEDWRGRVYKESQHDGFYESPEWRKLRRQCLQRDKYTCQRCDKKMKWQSLNAHHIMPRSEGGNDTIENLITLCEPCHDFVEIGGYKDRATIVGSYEQVNDNSPDNEEQEIKPETPKDDDPYHRPEWHKWVYGGVKRKS